MAKRFRNVGLADRVAVTELHRIAGLLRSSEKQIVRDTAIVLLARAYLVATGRAAAQAWPGRDVAAFVRDLERDEPGVVTIAREMARGGEAVPDGQ